MDGVLVAGSAAAVTRRRLCLLPVCLILDRPGPCSSTCSSTELAEQPSHASADRSFRALPCCQVMDDVGRSPLRDEARARWSRQAETSVEATSLPEPLPLPEAKVLVAPRAFPSSSRRAEVSRARRPTNAMALLPPSHRPRTSDPSPDSLLTEQRAAA
jgi:hypothetical protein